MNVYKHYNQEELDDQYNVRLQVPNYASYFDRAETLSRQTDQLHHFLKDIPYGELSEESLDIFPSEKPHSKILVFIHGGYWYLHDKDMFHFLAGFFLKYNVTTVLMNYPLAPQSSMNEIVNSCRKGLEWLHDNIVRFNGDPAELWLLGHSAGGHLASMMMTGDEAKFVRGIISLSGLFRLEPVMLSYINDSIGMDRENAIKNSPVLLNPANDCPLLLAAGAKESDEFKAQTEELYSCWKSKNSNITSLSVPEQNHFSILFAVVEKDPILWAAISRMMNIDSESH